MSLFSKLLNRRHDSHFSHRAARQRTSRQKSLVRSAFRPRFEQLERREVLAAVMVADIWPGLGSNFAFAPVVSNGAIYFAANDGVHGRELWKSNGTAAGTSMVKDIPGGGLTTLNVTDVDGTLYFNAFEPTHLTDLSVGGRTGGS